MRVLAINDISCVGKCSLTTALPIISACGVECSVLPTAILSTHTGGFTGYTFHDLTSEIPDILTHWKSLGLQFDFICSGYLGSIDQIETVKQIRAEFLKEDGKFIVDPVMGDSGRLYAGFTGEFIDKMRELCRLADYILPNVTEACYLADVPYPLTKNTAPCCLEKLQKLCQRAMITGVTDESGISVWYTGEKGETQTYAHENVAGFFHGAGDVFAAAFIGALARGKSEKTAIELASNFVTAAIRRTAKEVPDRRYGLNFEAEIYPFLQKLNG